MKKTFFALALLAASVASFSLDFPVAANVPANTPWDLGLTRIAADWKRISGGKVTLSFPAWARIANESDAIQQMQFDVKGAVITSIGLSLLYPDSMLLSIPTMVRSEAELDAALAAYVPLLERKIGDKYQLICIVKGGWLRMFSNKPLAYPRDFSGFRIGTDVSNTKLNRMLQTVGAIPVKATNDALPMMMGSSIDGFYSSPLFVSGFWSQFKGKVTYMSGIKFAPFIAAFIVNKKDWAKVDASMQTSLIQAARAAAADMSVQSSKLEDAEIAKLSKAGLSVSAVPADADQAWIAFYDSKLAPILRDLFSSEAFNAIDAAVAGVRKAK
jgi:TRAP-type C4-dicarboxylate transport system substrate-binding protein